MAPRDETGGVPYDTQIKEAINECGVVVLPFSKNADDSVNVEREIRLALDRGKPVVPFRIEDVVPVRLKFHIGGLQWITGFPGPLERHIPFLLDSVEARLGIFQWQKKPIQVMDKIEAIEPEWHDIYWSGLEGWLCGALTVGGGGGDVGAGILLQTLDGGDTWCEVEKKRFESGQGTFTWGPRGTRHYQWEEVGPITSISFYRRHVGGGKFRREGWLSSSTGIYRTEDGNVWKRSTPPPSHPERYAFFSNFTNLEAFAELYAVGWQGIAHWRRDGTWELQAPTYFYPISGISASGGSETRRVWAVGRAGEDETGAVGSDSYGAVFHLEWPTNRWVRMLLTGVNFRKAQALSDIIQIDDATVFAVGQGGMIIRGRGNGGDWTWDTLASNTERDLNSITCHNGLLWAVGASGTILRSYDRGDHWISSSPGKSQGFAGAPLHRIRFFGNVGWIMGNNVILKCVSGLPI
jgi:photosystem II stability/assembly factor-like uncharacterized protein